MGGGSLAPEQGDVMSNDTGHTATYMPAQFLPAPPHDAWDWFVKGLIVLGLAGLIWASLQSRWFAPLLAVAESHGLSAALVRPSMIWFAMGAGLLAFRTLLWFLYRAPPVAAFDAAPSMTVVIPAYNEGAMVAKAIDSVAAAIYPRHRLEIIVIDDGSRDDTWFHIQQAVRRHGSRIVALRQEHNRGKREALALAFTRGTGDVFVTVDSDSVIEPQALLALAGAFSNPRVGVVAGRVLVYNRREGTIPRMLNARFMLAFDFLRAYQSTYGTVYCSPGALSAYRASAVRRVLDKWLAQRFLGAQATFGEDRALTNDIMSLGYDSVYQRGASVLTVVPTTYRQLCRMFLRWERSFVREELRFVRIVWRRPPLARLIAIVDVTITNMRYPIFYATLALLILFAAQDPLAFGRTMLSMGAIAFLYALYFLRSERSADMLYVVLFAYFSFFTLFWIFPYAVCTVRARGWLTR
jgi:hyaluronan synthase